ncbi:metalloenzyme domain protein [Deinococcus sp. KSM4-11]|uniref:metalloenzyme domain protein n=1 Tax=Deinococcus sp. KSM4-11 TaxID=2568654 RepID=UPI0010A3F7EF|nr:metalloenzyme domain protein [Deinococcus sp. KSM4-11]THF85235.1 metalloenzyme domain protein [Deinococcus sp. KSM4-11]
MSGIVWLALDGVGHPLDAPPGSVWEQHLPTLRPLVDAGRALDATLDVPGLPQSGTGQACWLTGTDAVALMGEHYGPHPGPTLQKLLRERSLPVQLAQAGARIALANHYVPAYFEAQAAGPRRNRVGCFPFSFQAAGAELNPPGVPGVGATLGLNFRTPWEPVQPLDDVTRLGTALAGAAPAYDLITLDLWFSDLLGHEGAAPLRPEVLAAGRAYLRRVDALLTGLLEAGARVVLSSDHGNLEDLRVKGHTVARVPFCGSGVELGSPDTVVEGGTVIAGWFGMEIVENAEF